MDILQLFVLIFDRIFIIVPRETIIHQKMYTFGFIYNVPRGTLSKMRKKVW